MASYDPNKVKMTIGGIEIAGCESFETTDVVSGIDGEVKLSKKEECNHGVGLINGQCMLCTLEERIEEYAKEERQGLLLDSLHNWSECTLSDVIDDLGRYADAEKEDDDGPTVKQLLNVTYPEQDWADAIVDKILRENGGMIPYGKNPYKEEGVKEIKYPGPEEYGKNNCGTGILTKCSTCEKDTNDFYRISFDSMFPVLTPPEVWWLCTSCYDEHVVGPTKEEKVEEIKYPGPEAYKLINGGTTYNCRTCKRVGFKIRSAQVACDYEATQICSDCYHEHVVEPNKEETVEEKTEYLGKEYYELFEFAELSNCYTCQADVRTFYRIRGDGLRLNAPRKTRWLCSDCYEKHVVGSELAPMKKVEPPKPAFEYPTSEKYFMAEQCYHYIPYTCCTCGVETSKIHALSCARAVRASTERKAHYLCPDCFTANVKDPEPVPAKVEEYDYLKSSPLLNGIVDPS